jgi:hypothetical protein
MRSFASRDTCCSGKAVTRIVQCLELGSPSAGAPPKPPPSSNLFAAAFPSTVSSPDASSCGEQGFPRPFSLPCTLKPPHGLAGEADQPPSGAGCRGCPRHSPDPLGLLACFPTSCRVPACMPRHLVQRDRAAPANPPPLAAALRRARRRPSLASVQSP